MMDAEIIMVDLNGRWLAVNLRSGEWIECVEGKQMERLRQLEKDRRGEIPAGVTIVTWPERILPPVDFESA
jgi:hypothetical protein